MRVSAAERALNLLDAFADRIFRERIGFWDDRGADDAWIELLAVELDELGADRVVLAQPPVLRLNRWAFALLVGIREELPPFIAQRAGLCLIEREVPRDVPVFIRNKRTDLALAFDDQSDRDGLHTPGAESTRDLLPKQRRDLVPHDAIEDPSRLLRIYSILVDRVRVVKRLIDLRLGDRGEDHTLRVLGIDFEFLRKMPRDRFPFAIKVGREPDFATGSDRVLRRCLQVLHDLFFALENLIARLEPLLDLHARHGVLDTLGVLGREIAHVPHGRENHEVRTEVFVDRFRLCGGFHDHQRLALRVALAIVRPERLAAGRLLRRLLGRFLRGLLFGGLLLSHRACVAS